MKLTSISIEGCGRFGTLTRIEGLGPGVNILAARNEAGKSTFFRAIRTCLFERHSSANKDIAALATEGLSLPVSITVGFERAGKHYEIRKSFLKSKSATLLCDGVETARNSEADEEVWKLLGIEPKSARALDEAAYGMLWVRQGHSFECPEPSEGAKSVLNSVIQQEVGTLVGGERARAVLANLRDEISKLLTDSRKPRANGPLDAAQKESERLTTERMEVETRLQELNGKIDELAQLRQELKAASDAATLQNFREELAEAQRKLADTEKADEELKRLAGDERQAHALAEAQREKLDALTRRAEAVDGYRARLKELADALKPLAEQEEQASAALKKVTARKAELDSAAEALEARDAELQRLSALAARLSARAALASRLERLVDFRGRAARNEAELKSATVDEAALKSLEALEQEEATLRARLEAGAARVTIEARAGGVAMNGTPVEGNAARSVTEPVVITVGTDVAITISPPPATLAAAEKALQELRGKFKALLQKHGARDAAELRQLRSARASVEEQARELRAERSALSLKDGLSPEIERLEGEIAAVDAAAQHVLGSSPPPDGMEIERQKTEIAEVRGEQRVARAGCEAEMEAHSRHLTRLAAERGTLRGQIEEIHTRLESELALLPDETRAAVIAEAARDLEARRDQHRIRAAVLDQKQAQAPGEGEAERLRARAERFATAIRTRTDETDRLRQKIARLEGEIQSAGGDGLGERAALLKIQQELATAEAQRQAERAEVLSHLRSTVEQCYARRREQLNAPLRRHLKPYLNDVFPEADIELGENFAISGLTRSAPSAEGFERLSLGTQEQVAVLVRLAMGAMICERGEDVPVILDDALVFSDDARIEQMFDAISRAGRLQQVIVFTCRARSFASLGGRQLRIV